MSKLKSAVFLCLLLISSKLYSQIDDISLGLGNTHEFIDDVQINNTGDKNGISNLELDPYVSMAFTFNIEDDWYFIPEVSFQLPNTSEDENTTKYSYLLKTSIGYRLYSFQFIAGTGLAFNTIKGKGGTQKLDNGLGTDNFPVPSSTATSSNLILSLGTEYFPVEEISTKLELLVYNIHAPIERSYSYTIGLSYHTGKINLN